MRRLLWLSRDEALASVGAIVLATIACLSPVHNDTWWHLAYGRHMADVGGFAQTDPFSFTAYNRPFPNHQWLGERIFYTLHMLGGMPLLTAFCGALLTTAWIVVWRLGRGAVTDRLLITGTAAAASTLIWSIRPQVFTIVLLPAITTFLARGRLRWIPLMVLIWANLHGGVLLGVVVVSVWTLVAVATGRRRTSHISCLATCLLATFITPLGMAYWPEVFRSLVRSQVNRLQEWQPPSLPPQHLFFWGLAALLIVFAARRWRHIRTDADLGLTASSLVLLIPAIRTLRNTAPFVMLAAPALSRLLDAQADVPGGVRRRVYGAVPVVAGALAAGVVWAAWSQPWPRLQWAPLTPSVARAIAECPGPLYNSYGDGGPIIWFVPSQRVFLDSRQDQFPTALVSESTAIENGGSPFPLFAEHRIRCAALKAGAPAARQLLEAGWQESYRDATWVVLVSPARATSQIRSVKSGEVS
jgi:hypothetical protein